MEYEVGVCSHGASIGKPSRKDSRNRMCGLSQQQHRSKSPSFLQLGLKRNR
jgi:hypothetical protein